MTKFYLPSANQCRACGAQNQILASLAQDTVEWRCDQCGASDYIFLDGMHFRIGQRFFLASERLIADGEEDLAAVLLVTALDATLCDGISTLMRWRAIEKLTHPPEEAEIEQSLLRLRSFGDRLARFEELAGATVDEEITRLRALRRLPSWVPLSKAGLKHMLDPLQTARNDLVHRGREVSPHVVESARPWVGYALEILESMWHAAFDVRSRL